MKCLWALTCLWSCVYFVLTDACYHNALQLCASCGRYRDWDIEPRCAFIACNILQCKKPSLDYVYISNLPENVKWLSLRICYERRKTATAHKKVALFKRLPMSPFASDYFSFFFSKFSILTAAMRFNVERLHSYRHFTSRQREKKFSFNKSRKKMQHFLFIKCATLSSPFIEANSCLDANKADSLNFGCLFGGRYVPTFIRELL